MSPPPFRPNYRAYRAMIIPFQITNMQSIKDWSRIHLLPATLVVNSVVTLIHEPPEFLDCCLKLILFRKGMTFCPGRCSACKKPFLGCVPRRCSLQLSNCDFFDNIWHFHLEQHGCTLLPVCYSPRNSICPRMLTRYHHHRFRPSYRRNSKFPSCYFDIFSRMLQPHLDWIFFTRAMWFWRLIPGLISNLLCNTVTYKKLLLRFRKTKSLAWQLWLYR